MSHQISAKITRLLRIIERNPRRAMPYVVRLSADSDDRSPQDIAWGRFLLGWTFLYWEDFDTARVRLQEAYDLFQELQESYGEARSLYGLALADVLQLGSANGKLEECERRFRVLGSNKDLFRIQIYKAVELNSRSLYSKASEWLEKHKDFPREDGELDYARWLRVRASAAVGMGDLDDARKMLLESEAIFTRAKYKVDLAKCRFELAWNELQHEDIQTAFELYTNAHTLFTKLDMPFRIAFCLKSLGLVQSRFGAYDIALSHTLQALEMFTKYQRRRDIAGCQLNLGNIYFHAGRWEEALYCYERAEQIYREADVGDELLRSIRNRAGVYEHLERFDEALALLKTHRDLTLDNDHKGEKAEGLLLQAEILARISSEQSDEILELTQQAYEIFARNNNLAGTANSLRVKAELLLRLGRAEEAEELFSQALPYVQGHAHMLWAVHYGLAESAVAQSHPQQALRSYREAAVRMASLRRRILSEEFSSSMYHQAETLYQNGIRYASAQRDYETVLLLSESQRALVLQRMLLDHEPIRSDLGSAYETLRREMQDLMEDQAIERNREATDSLIARYTELLVHSRHQHVRVQDPASEEFHFELDELREELHKQYGHEWSCISYSFHGDQLLATIITPDDLAQEIIPFDPELQKQFGRLYEKKRQELNYVNLPKLGSPSRWGHLEYLGARLLPSALVERLNPNHRLLIVPCEQLHGVLWSALRIRGQWLMQQAVIQVLPALSIVPLLAQRRRWQQERKVLLLGCSDFAGRMKALPNVEQELKLLQNYYGERAEYVFPATRKEVLERASRGELQEYGTIHIASHGQLRTGRGLMAALMFTDDDLLLSELAALELDGALVTLSACEGATTDLLPGEEAFSLSRAFLVAGARAVLASQLPVRDGIAMAFMQKFHACLDLLEDPALALMETQRYHVNTYGDQGFDLLGLPIGWGSFVLTGV